MYLDYAAFEGNDEPLVWKKWGAKNKTFSLRIFFTDFLIAVYWPWMIAKKKSASGGAVALIRIGDKKVMFYAYAGGNTHSAEILPDGSIMAASSTGNFMTVFRVDTLRGPKGVYSKQGPLPNGHNVVWDRKRNVLWSASDRHLKSFIYNYNANYPDLKEKDSIILPETDSHDLFPDYDCQSLLLTGPKGLYRFSFRDKKIEKMQVTYLDIKSASTGLEGIR